MTDFREVEPFCSPPIRKQPPKKPILNRVKHEDTTFSREFISVCPVFHWGDMTETIVKIGDSDKTARHS